jgi:hypothetical protein
MYNLFFNSKGATNKGKFQILFPNEGLWFKPGSLIALSTISVYNSIYNISSYRNNNKLYIKLDNEITHNQATELDTDDSTYWVYEINIENGQYSAEMLDEYIAKVIGDWDTSTNDFKAHSSRQMKISANTSFGKFDIYTDSDTDVLFRVGNTTSANLAYLLGFDMSISGTENDKTYFEKKYTFNAATNTNKIYIKSNSSISDDNVTELDTDSSTYWVYEVLIDDGTYTATTLNTFITDIIGANKMTISSDTTSEKFSIVLENSTDLLFKVGDTTSTNVANILGFNMSSDGTASDKTTYDSIDYWDLTKYRSNHSVGTNLSINTIASVYTEIVWDLTKYRANHTLNGNLGIQVAKIQNGRTNIHLHLRNNIIFGGYDASGSQSDTIFAFDFTSAPGYLQTFNVTNLTWLNVVATSRYLDRLEFEFTDQDGNALAENMYEDCAFALVVKEPEASVPSA